MRKTFEEFTKEMIEGNILRKEGLKRLYEICCEMDAINAELIVMYGVKFDNIYVIPK